MICFSSIVLGYLIIGALVSYTAYKNDWNGEMAHRFDQGSNFGWFIAWPWYGIIYISYRTNGWWGRLSGFIENQLSALFDRLIAIEWRKNGTKDES